MVKPEPKDRRELMNLNELRRFVNVQIDLTGVQPAGLPYEPFAEGAYRLRLRKTASGDPVLGFTRTKKNDGDNLYVELDVVEPSDFAGRVIEHYQLWPGERRDGMGEKDIRGRIEFPKEQAVGMLQSFGYPLEHVQKMLNLPDASIFTNSPSKGEAFVFIRHRLGDPVVNQTTMQPVPGKFHVNEDLRWISAEEYREAPKPRRGVLSPVQQQIAAGAVGQQVGSTPVSPLQQATGGTMQQSPAVGGSPIAVGTPPNGASLPGVPSNPSLIATVLSGR